MRHSQMQAKILQLLSRVKFISISSWLDEVFFIMVNSYSCCRVSWENTPHLLQSAFLKEVFHFLLSLVEFLCQLCLKVFSLSCGSFRLVPVISLLSVFCLKLQLFKLKTLNWFGFIELLLRLSLAILLIIYHFIVFFDFEHPDF